MVRVGGVEGGFVGGVHELTERVFGLVRGWVGGEGLVGARLVFVVGGGLGHGGVVGLVRSAVLEYPGRFGLVWLDGSEASEASLVAALDAGVGEVAVCDGVLLVPRLGRVGGLRVPAGGGGWRQD